ncbi:MAG: glucose sorbosone dehydrogenase, partial [Dehalococcoidia bacterium]|nr:glucose sorbosone dehydrogenase [Dehalococcoidia bacterium]
PRRAILSRFDYANGQIDGDSEDVLLTIDHKESHVHYGGGTLFGPDGYLYIGVGDGGPQGDPDGHAQDRSHLGGSILRIDVRGSVYAIPEDNPYAGNTDGFREEIWAYGFRNPWRLSFDDDGRLWVGDAGHNEYEEVDIVEAGKNYGWNIVEGYECYSQPGCDQTGLQPPVAVYDHGSLHCAIVGGHVYEGDAIPELRGHFVYADYCTGAIWATSIADPSQTVLLFDRGIVRTNAVAPDQNGEILVLTIEGIYRLAPADQR